MHRCAVECVVGKVCLAAFLFVSLLISPSVFAAGDANNLVRVQVTDKSQADLLPKGLDIAGYKPGEWVDAVVTDQQVEDLVSRGLFVQILSKDVNALLREAAEFYPTYAEFQTQLNDIVTSNPSICSMDTIGTTYEGRPIQVVKVSDNVGIDEDEPEVLYTGLTHAREWPGLVTTMFILDSLTSAYGTDPAVTAQVDGNEVFIIPCMNPDGYVYTRDLGIDWRKNRRPFPEYGTVGVDLNRNYAGSTDGNPEGEWGTTIGSITHDPSSSIYCGPYPFSEAETQAERDFIETRDFVAGITYHTHGELVLWPWGYGYGSAPNSDYLQSLGVAMANLITQQDGVGYYEPEQAAGLYPTSGDATDWVYGYHHYVQGRDFLFYTIEMCQQFQPPTGMLAQIVRENFDGAFYMLQEAVNVRLDLTPRVIPPIVSAPPISPSGDYTVSWTEVNPPANPTHWQIDELTDLSISTQDVEGSYAEWDLGGFSVSTARSHSSSHSFKSSEVDEAADALTSVHPYPVEFGDSLTFWVWYEIEEGWDYGYVEVSTDGREFDILDLFTGASSGWEYKRYSLDAYAGQSLFFRFRYTTDSYVLEEGMYVDDIYPSPEFNTITTLSSTETGNSYDITGQPAGTYYYRVRGSNIEWSWCDFSTLKKVSVEGAATGTLSGTVTDSVTGELLDGIYMTLLDGSTPVASTYTASGEYSFNDVDPGTYSLRASDAYYVTKIVSNVVVEASQTTDLDLELAYNRGWLSGVVTDDVLHAALSGVDIVLTQGSSTIGSTTTNSSGEYEFSTLWPGGYDVQATRTGYITKHLYASVVVRDTTDLSFEMTPTDVCGDADGSGEVDIDDVVYLILYIFSSGPPPDPAWVGDADCSGDTDIDDAVYLIQYIFSAGPAPCSGC